MPAAMKATKRAAVKAAAAPAPAAKKVKGDPMIEGVKDAIEKATEFSEPCRNMLIAGLPGAVATPREQRHDIQHQLIAMIEEVLSATTERLQGEVDAEVAKLGEVDSRRADLQRTVQDAEEALTGANGEVSDKSKALASATEATLSAKGAFQEKQEVQRSGDSALIKDKERKAALEKAMEEDLKALLEATEEPKQQYDALQPVLKDLALDESLLSALPNVCSKKAADRGAFGTMVLEQLRQSLRERVAALTKVLDEAEPAAQARAADVSSAQAAAEDAAAAQRAAAETLSTASSAQQAADAALAAARKAVADFEPSYLQAAAARDERTKALEDFKGHNVNCFETLRDKTADAGAPAGGA